MSFSNLKLSVGYKLIITIVIALIIQTVIFMLTARAVLVQDLIEDSENRLRFELLSYSQITSYLSELNSLQDLQKYLSLVATDHAIALAFISDENGKILASTKLADVNELVENVLETDVRQDYLQHLTLVVKQQKYQVWQTNDQNKTHAIASVVLGRSEASYRSDKIGTLFIEYDLSGQLQQINRNIVQWAALLALVMVMVATPLVLFIQFSLTRRISQLAVSTGAVVKSQYRTRLDTSGQDEISQVAKVLNRVLDQVEEQHRQLFLRERRLLVILESIADGVVVTDADGIIERINPVACNMTGWKLNDALGQSIFHIYRTTSKDDIEPPLDRVLRTKQQSFASSDIKLHSHDGRVYQVSESASPIFDSDQNLQGMVLVFRNITSQFELKQKLLQSESTLRSIMQNTPAVIFVRDKAGRFTYLNDKAEQLFAHKKSHMYGKTLEEFFSTDIAVQLNSEDQTVLADGLVYQSEIHLPINGHEHIFFTVKFPIYDEHGHIDGVGGIATDITERRSTDQRITEIALGVSASIGERFFEQLVLQVDKLLHKDFVFVGRVKAGHTVDTLAVASGGKVLDNFSYDLQHTPCDDVMGNQICIIDKGVIALYPQDLLLEEMSIDGYIGIRLEDISGNAIGILVVLNRSPITDGDEILNVLRIFAARAASEIERILAAEQKDRAQNRLTHHINNTPVAVIEWNTQFQILSWNPAAEAIFGYRADEAIGRPLTDLVVPKDLVSYVEEIKNDLLKDKGGEFSTNRNLTKDGQILICDWHNTSLTDEKGIVIGGASLISDVTADKEMLNALIKKEQEHREILDSMIESVITIDDEGIVLSFNHAAQQMFGYTPEQIIGENISMLMPPHDAGRHDNYIANYLTTGRKRIIGLGREVTAKRADDSVFPVRLSVSELPSSEGQIRRFIGSFVDLSELKSHEEQVRRAQKMDALGKLTGGIAHDFNNMLGIVLGYCDLLEHKLSDYPKYMGYVKEIHRAGTRGAKLTQRLLAFSKNKKVNATELNINQVLSEGQNMLQKTLTPQVILHLQLTDSVWLVYLDESEFEDAVLNLSINAMHAMNGAGELTIHTENTRLDDNFCKDRNVPAGEYVKLSVMDQGCGMDEATLNLIFDPFFTTKGDKGTGLGLSQVYGFVNRTNGAINVVSQIGEGSCFELYFPRRIPSADISVRAEHESLETSGTETILLVDDEKPLLNATSEILTQQGYQVLTAENAEQALQVLATHKVDILLSDVIMPGQNGFDLASQVKRRYPSIKIQLASGFTEQMAHLPEDDPLVVNLLTKPYQTKALLARLRTLVNDG